MAELIANIRSPPPRGLFRGDVADAEDGEKDSEASSEKGKHASPRDEWWAGIPLPAVRWEWCRSYPILARGVPGRLHGKFTPSHYRGGRKRLLECGPIRRPVPLLLQRLDEGYAPGAGELRDFVHE